MRCLLQMPPVDPLVVRHLRTCLPTGNRFIPRGSKPDDRDSAVCPSNIGVILQVRVPLQQLPSFFIRLRPVLPVDAGADLAILAISYKRFCRFAAVANHMPHAKACVTVIESVSVRNQAFAQIRFLAMPDLLAAGANFSGTQDLPRLDELSE